MIRLTMPAVEQRLLLTRFWRRAAGFWSGPSAFVAWGTTALLIATVILQLLIQYRLNLWQRDFYDALERRYDPAIWAQAAIFVGLVVASTLLILSVTWGRMTAQRCWRNWLSARMVEDWLASAPDAKRDDGPEWLPTPEYRVAEDASVATQLPVDFAIGLLSSVLGAITFIGVLWSVGGDLAVGVSARTLTIPGYLVIAAVLYAVMNTLAMLLVGRQLLVVIEAKNQAEAELRQAGTALREISEGSRPASRERDDSEAFGVALTRVSAVGRLMCHQLMATLFVSHGSSVLAPVIALMLCVPKFLADQLTLGEVMQLVAAFAIVQTAFNWLVDNYPRMAEWLSAVNRVALFLASLDQAKAVRPPPTAAPRSSSP